MAKAKKKGGLPKWAIKQAGGDFKKAWALKKRGRKTSTKSPSRSSSKGRSVSKRSNPRSNKAPGIGSMYQAGKGSHALLAPVIGTTVAVGFPRDEATLRAALTDLKARAGLPYLASLAVEAASQAMDRKFAHATALTKGSVTAWAAEVYALAIAIFEARKLPDAKARIGSLNNNLSVIMRAYNSRTGKIQIASETWIYHGAKVGGGLARRLSNTKGPLKKVFAGPKRLLKALGARA